MDVFGELRVLRSQLKKHFELAHDTSILIALDNIHNGIQELRRESDERYAELASALISLGAKIDASKFYVSPSSAPVSNLEKTYYTEEEMYIPDVVISDKSVARVKTAPVKEASQGIGDSVDALGKALG